MFSGLERTTTDEKRRPSDIFSTVIKRKKESTQKVLSFLKLKAQRILIIHNLSA